MTSPPTVAMSESNPAAVLPSLPPDLQIPVDSDNGSTAQPTPTHSPMPLPPATPQVSITFLVISGGRRTMSFEPSFSIGRVKELVWLSWPPDWSDERPPSPSYLRILYLGRLLQEDDILESIPNPLAPRTGVSSPSPTSPTAPTVPVSPIIMHLSVRPAPPSGEDDDVKKKRRRIGRTASSASGNQTGGDAENSSCCGCIIC